MRVKTKRSAQRESKAVATSADAAHDSTSASDSTTTSESENTSGADADTEESITSEEEPEKSPAAAGKDAEKWVAVRAQQQEAAVQSEDAPAEAQA